MHSRLPKEIWGCALRLTARRRAHRCRDHRCRCRPLPMCRLCRLRRDAASRQKPRTQESLPVAEGLAPFGCAMSQSAGGGWRGYPQDRQTDRQTDTHTRAPGRHEDRSVSQGRRERGRRYLRAQRTSLSRAVIFRPNCRRYSAPASSCACRSTARPACASGVRTREYSRISRACSCIASAGRRA